MRGGNTDDINSSCVQGSHPSRNYSEKVPMNPQSPVSAWQYHHPVITKTEPMEENEIAFQVGNNQYSTSQNAKPSYYTPITTSSAMDYQNNLTSSYPYSHLPLTPPDSEPMVSPENQATSPSPDVSKNPTAIHVETSRSTTIVKAESPHLIRSNSGQTSSNCQLSPNRNQMDLWLSQNETNGFSVGHLQNLEKSLEKRVSLAERRNSGSSCDDSDRKSIDEDIRVPKVNSNGKLKIWKCKQCEFTAKTKIESWEHAKIHIKPEKLLTCTMCPFVTEFKHHLEYHILNHTGRKPYKCDQCDYRCVNKSMLSSHAKCHSDIHQYRCNDCNYASKYCHSLKLHLRKYGHRPSKVLNPDGTENPYPIIDVYGTRRGPKIKQPAHQQHGSQQEHMTMNSAGSSNSPVLPYGLPQFMLPPPQLQQFFPFPLVNGFPPAIPNPMLLQNLQRLVKEKQAELENKEIPEPNRTPSPKSIECDVLDLSKPNSDTDTPKHRRKGRAFKINDIPAESSDDETEDTTTMFSNVEVVQNEDGNSEGEAGHSNNESDRATDETENDTNNNKTSEYVCQPCGITFSDAILHNIHMGFHGFNDPFTCNVCGQQCKDRVNFYLHVLRPRHQHGDVAQ